MEPEAELLLDEFDWFLPDDTVAKELAALKKANNCYCDDKRDQFDLEERLLGDEPDPPRPSLSESELSLDEYFAM